MVLAQHSRPAHPRANPVPSNRLPAAVILAWAFVVVATLSVLASRQLDGSVDTLILVAAVTVAVALAASEARRAAATERAAWVATVAALAMLGTETVARSAELPLPQPAAFIALGALLAAGGQLMLNYDIRDSDRLMGLDVAWIAATFLAAGFLTVSPSDLPTDIAVVGAVALGGLGAAVCSSAGIVHAAHLRPDHRGAVVALTGAMLVVIVPAMVATALGSTPLWFVTVEPFLWLTVVALLGITVSAQAISGDLREDRSSFLEQALVWIPLIIFIPAYVGAHLFFDPPLFVLTGIPPLVFLGVVLRLVAVVRTNSGLASKLTQQLAEHTEIEKHLHFRANHDDLTGLPNRALTVERLQLALDRSRRSGDRVSVLWVDLDRFKVVNDSMGHKIGDDLLRKVADRLRRDVDPADIVGRLGGDEFVVVMPDPDGSRPPTAAARKLISNMAEPFEVGGVEIWIGASVGIALHSDIEDTAESLLRDANAAMHRAKSEGRSRYELFDQEMRNELLNRMRIESSLRRAIDRDELCVVYQAQADAAEHDVRAFEALVRWNRPGNTVGPDQFIPVAEETGLIGEIGMWVLERACWDCTTWVRPDGRAPRVSVNVSGLQLASPLLVENVAEILKRTGLDPDRLTLEITETTLVDDPDLARLRLVKLRELGIRIAVDDFGTGYSSLSYLREFPLDEVKLDKAFIEGLGIEDTSTKIIASVVGLARDLGYEVVAEGVEERSQLDDLARLGAHLAQGYLISRPVPATEIPALLSRPPLAAASTTP